MPKVKTLQIVWHGKEPVYSLDFHPNGTLATAGADKEVKLWEVAAGEDGYANVNHLNTLQGHSKTVNCVRYSPSGSHLVSAGDGGELLLWQPSEPATAATSATDHMDTWKRSALLRGHTDDVMDLSWAADGTALLSGSIDNKAIVWEVSAKKKGQMLTQFANHKHFVQGVAWDPIQQFVVTQSADRTCKVYALRPPPAGRKNKVSQHLMSACENGKEFYCSTTLSKRTVTSTKPDGEQKLERHPLFHDESIPSFFRRLEWSPDGSFLLVPAGLHPTSSFSSSKDANTVYIYGRGNWAAPIAHLPGHSKPVVAVRFCPVVFEKTPQEPKPQQEGAEAATSPFNLPYKMVFAVATLDSVVIYDTESTKPLAVLGQLHYDSITDLAWSPDAKYLAVASRDCYCSIAVFKDGELGTRYAKGVRKIPQKPAAMAPKVVVAAAAAAAAQAVQLDVQPMEVCRATENDLAVVDLTTEAKATAAATTADPESSSADPLAQPGSTLVNGKKRITPTPVSTSETADRFGKAKEAATTGGGGQPAPADAQEPAKVRRRITPIPVKGGEEGLTPVESGVPVSQPPVSITPPPAAAAAAEPASGSKSKPAVATFNIAALALAAGQQAAMNANNE